MSNVVNLASHPSFSNNEPKKIYRFDIFKGTPDHEGKIQKVRSVGHGSLVDGYRTCRVFLKCLLNEEYYLLADRKHLVGPEFVLLTRQPSALAGKKNFWNTVGTGALLQGSNAGILRLSWDVFCSDDIYMNLVPIGEEVPGPESFVALDSEPDSAA